MLSPANNPEAFAVGAVDGSDAVEPSSGRGPSACGQPVAPRLVAPGVNVHTTDLYGLYTDPSGTSVAAPHVAGALAVLLSALPDTSADRQAAALESGAVDLGVAGPDADAGYGRLDVTSAYQWLAATPDFSVGASPRSLAVAAGASAQYTVAVNRVNGFTGAVALSLSGLAPAQASWSFAPSSLPNGSNTALLTITTAASIPAGTYSLQINGVSGTTSRSTFVTLLVPDFTLAVAPATRTIVAGGSTTYSIAVGAVAGFSGTVSIAVSSLPSGATVTLSRNPVPAGGSAVLTVRTSASTPRGTFTVRITGSNGALSHQATATLTIR